MKKLALIALMAISSIVNACYDEATTKVDNNLIYAEVISRSHLNMQFVLVLKDADIYSLKTTVVGGKGFKLATLPECSPNQEVEGLNWVTNEIATHGTSTGSLSYTAAYRVCIYNLRNQLQRSFDVCNNEVGD